MAESEGQLPNPEAEGDKAAQIAAAEAAAAALSDEEPKGTGEGDEATVDVVGEIPPDDGEDDPISAAVEEQLKLQQERLREQIAAEVRKEYETKQADESRRATQLAEQNQLRDSFVSSLRESYTGITGKKFYNEDGDEIKFSDEDFENYVAKPMQKHNSVVRDIVQGTVLTQLADTALNSLPDEDSRRQFTEAASEKPLDEWLKTYAETSAKGTKVYRDLESEVEAKVKAAYARGYAKGQKGPVATPKQGEERPQSQSHDTSTISGIAHAKAAGQISDEEAYDLIKKLKR